MADFEQRILIHAVLSKDAELISTVLGNSSISCHVCKDLQEVSLELELGVSVLLTVEEALASRAAAPVYDFLGKQPSWSDLPILVLTTPGANSQWISQAYERIGNLTLLERPIRTSTLLSAARSALRARQRQYEIRLYDQRKDEFLAMLAHELRNPLAPIGAAAQLLELVHADPEKVKQSSKIIGRQVKHMTNLLDDLLDVARVTRGLVSLNKVPLDINAVLTQAVEQAAPLIKGLNHDLSLHLSPAPAWVSGDEKRLVQVLTNLLTNAARYTPEGGSIDVRLTLDVDQVILKVSDNGIGMTPEMITRVFDLFAQAEKDSARSQGGLGLGLALVKSLLSLHGGCIVAESAGLAQGSCFTIKLPRLEHQPDQSSLGETVSRIAKKKNSLRVMVVDDNVDAALMLELLLNVIGHEVYVVHRATEAIERAKQVLPQVCLIDIGLPDLDGTELARHLRATPELAFSLLIAVTGYGQDKDKKNSLAAGFDHHLVKPVDTGELCALLAKVKAA